MTPTIQLPLTLTLVECADCYITWGLPISFENSRRSDHETFYCPAGHENYYPQQTDREKLEEQLRNVNSRLRTTRLAMTAARDQAEATERSNIALRGHLTRLRKRIAAGACPVQGCKRPFEAVGRHVRDVHPGWLHDHPEVEELLP